MNGLTRAAQVDGGFIYANRTFPRALACWLRTDKDVKIAGSVERRSEGCAR